jgi:hypothetical protein
LFQLSDFELTGVSYWKNQGSNPGEIELVWVGRVILYIIQKLDIYPTIEY